MLVNGIELQATHLLVMVFHIDPTEHLQLKLSTRPPIEPPNPEHDILVPFASMTRLPAVNLQVKFTGSHKWLIVQLQAVLAVEV